jgi:hypothetical protein
VEVTGRDARLARAAGPAALALLFVALVAWSFRKWTDVHIDFGGELYIPWQLSQGQELYRDIAYRHGPLSPYWNALLFRVFGVSLQTLVVANLAVLAGIAAMLFRIFDRACDRITATVCVAVMLCVFAFGQYGWLGNYNYVTPYQHHQTHGLALSLALLLCLDTAARRDSRRWLVLGGACLGAVFLTKAELFVPAVAMAAAAFAARRAGLWQTSAGVGRELGAFGLGALLPVAALGAWLALHMPLARALTGLAGNWAHLSEVGADPFYRRNAGLDHPLRNVVRILTASGWIAAAVVALVGVDRLAGRVLAGRIARWLVALALALVLWLAPIPWWRSAPALPVLAAAAVLGLGAVCLRSADAALRARLYPLLLLAVYAAALLGKILLAASYDWYGFVLAMPATLLAVAAWVYGVPRWLHRHYGGGALARALALGVIAAAVGSFLSVSNHNYASRTFRVGHGGDAMLARGPSLTPRPQLLARTLAWLEARAEPGQTLLVLPEGIQLNYWLRLRNPSRFELFLPTEIRAFGEGAMLADLQAHPPDYVVLVHRAWKEFGVGPFGKDPRNGRALRAWVDAHYRRVQRFGAEPFGADGFGVVVLEREDPSARSAR